MPTMLLRQVQASRGVTLEHLLRPPDSQMICKGCRRAEWALSTSSVQLRGRHREIHDSSRLHDRRFPRYFWPSRPDFLPTKLVDSDKDSGPIKEESRGEITKKIRCFIPASDMRLTIPAPNEVPQSNRTLCSALHSDQKGDVLWSLFQEHIQDIKLRDVSPLESSLFDALFWSIGIAEESDARRLELLSTRLMELQSYSSKKGGYALTRLQLHRVIFVWNDLWQQQSKSGNTFAHLDYLDVIRQQLEYIHAETAGRIVKQMLEGCDSTLKLKPNLDFIEEYSHAQNISTTKVLRSEAWSSGSLAAIHAESVFFPKSSKRDFLKKTKYDLLTMASSLPASDEVLQIILIVLTRNGEDIDPDKVINCLRLFDKRSLCSLLPLETRADMERIDSERFKLDSSSNPAPSPLSPSMVLKVKEDHCLYLIQAIATSLASRKDCDSDFRLALHLFDRDISKRRKEDLTDFEIAAYVAAITSLAHHARKAPASESAISCLRQAMKIMAKIAWIDSRSGVQSARELLDALQKSLPGKDCTELTADEKRQFAELMRQYTTIILAADPNLAVLRKSPFGRPFVQLLRIFIDNEDYAFAKRIYIVESQRSGQLLGVRPPVSSDRYLWLFQASLTIDTDFALARLIFTHWQSLRNQPENAHFLPNLPSSLLRIYFSKLLASGRKEEMHTLQLLLDADRDSSFALDDKNNSRISARHNAIRTCRIAFLVGKERIDDALSISTTIIERWQQERHKGFEKIDTLIELYAIALEKSTIWLDQSTLLSRARVLLLFESFRSYFGLVDGKCTRLPTSTLPEDTQRNIHIIYRCAFDTLLRHEKGKPLQMRIKTNVRQLTTNWRIAIGADIYGAQIEAFITTEAGEECDEKSLSSAIEIFEEGLHAAQLRHELLPSVPVAKLIHALTARSDFTNADKVYQLYSVHTRAEPKSTIIMVEAAGIALAHQQGRTLEATWRVNDLIKKVQEEDKIPYKVKWLQALRRVGKTLQQSEDLAMTDIPQDSMTQVEKDRLKAFGALAGGQPWKSRMLRNKNRNNTTIPSH